MLWLTCSVIDTGRFLWFKTLGSSFCVVIRLRAGWSWYLCLIPDRRREFLYSSRLDWFRDPHILVANGYWRLCPWKESCRGIQITVCVCLVPRLRTRAEILPLPHTVSWHVHQHRNNCTFICDVVHFGNLGLLKPLTVLIDMLVMCQHRFYKSC